VDAGKAGIPQGARKVTQGRRGLNLQGRLPLWSRPIQVRPQRRPGHFAHGLGSYQAGVVGAHLMRDRVLGRA